MQQKLKLTSAALLLTGFACLSLTTAGYAGDIFRADTVSTLNLNGAWTTVAPTAADVAVWDATMATAGNGTAALGADLSWQGIRIANPVEAVTISAGNNLTLGTSGIDMSSADLVNLTLNNTVTIGGAQSWNVGSGRTLIAGGAVAINNLLTKDGLGAVTLSVANTGAGGLTVNNGTLSLGVTTAAGTGGITLNGGTLGVGNFTAFAPAINVAGTATVSASGTFQFNGAVTGSGTMNVALAGTGNTFTFNAGGASGMSAFTGTIHVNDGTQGFLRLSTSTGSTGATFDLGNSTIIMHTRGGQTSNLGGLAGGYGTVLEGARSANAADTYNIGANGLNTTFNGTISNGIVSSITPTVVNITKVGAGTLTLGGTNWYTGATLINAGTLALNNSVIASSSSVAVNTGGTLAGNGGIGSATTIAAGGFLAPGVTGVSIGTMTFSNSLVLAGTVTLDLNRNGGSPINDLVNVAGNALTEGGTLTVNNIGAALQSGDTFDLFTFGSETGTFSTINLPTLDSSLTWDTSQLTTTGIIDVTVVPEPATVAIIGLGGLAALGIRRRKA